MFERWFQKSWRWILLRYGAALLAGVMAAGLRHALIPVMGTQAPYTLLFAVIVVVAVTLGTGPGLAAAAIGIWAGERFLLDVPGAWRLTWATGLRISFILLGTAYVGHVGYRLRQARETARAEAATVRRSEEQLRLATTAAEIGVWFWTPGTNRVVVSANWRGIFGVPPEAEVTFETWQNALHPDDRTQTLNELLAAGREHREFHAEYRVVRPDGVIRWIVDRGRAVRDARGEPAGLAGVNVDITERRRAEEALRQSEQRLRAIFDRAGVGIVEVDAEDRFTAANDRALEVFGSSREDLLGKAVHDVVIPEDRSRSDRLHATLREGKCDRFEYEKRCMRPDGAVIWAHATVSAVRASDGRHLGAIITVEDISARKQAEAALRESEERFRTMFEGHGAAMLLIEPETGAIVDANRAATAFYGYSREQLQAMQIQQINQLPPEEVAQARRDIVAHARDRFIFPHRLSDGQVRWVEVYSSPVTIGGKPILFSIIHDITARRQAEEALRESEERHRALAEELARSNQDLEQFAYIASHDLQAPLRVVDGYVQIVLQDYGPSLPPEAREHLQTATGGVERMGRLIRDLLEYSRVGTKGRKPERTDMEQVFRETLNDQQAALRESGAVVTHDPLVVIWADATQMRQLLFNLVGNAVKFRKKDEPPRIHVGVTREKGGWHFVVRDNGIGIDPKFHDRIFQVFQRLHTEREYAGTGIGLAICKKIIERHGGRIWVESERDKGSAFHFTIPDREGQPG